MSNLTLRMTAGFVVTLAILLSFMGNAMAQDAKKRVMILKFDTLDVEAEVMDMFYEDLNQSIKDHEAKSLVPGGEVSVNEMIVTVGCEGPTPECLSQLQDFVEADQLLFGSVQRSGNIHLFTVRLFDFETQSFEAELEDQTVDGDRERVSEVIPTLIDGLLYGDVGVLEVKINGAAIVDIFLNGDKVGKSSTTMENLPLGEHVLMVRAASGEEQTQQVVLRKGKPTSTTFNFGDSGSAVDGADGGGNKLLLPGVGLVAVGLVGLGLGTAQYLGYRDDSDTMNGLTTCTDAAGGSVSDGTCTSPALKSAEDKGTYDDLESSRDRKYMRSVIGFSVGGVLTAAGGTLIYLGSKKTEARAQHDTEMKPLKERVKVQVITTQTYQGLQLNGSF